MKEIKKKSYRWARARMEDMVTKMLFPHVYTNDHLLAFANQIQWLLVVCVEYVFIGQIS